MRARLSRELVRSVVKRKPFVTILSSVLIALGLYLSRTITVRHLARAQVLTVPFVLEMDIYYFRDHPDGQLFSKRSVARRSDGATAEISPIGPLAWGQTGRKVTYLDGRSLSIVDLIASKTTWPLKSMLAIARLKERMLHPPRNCVFTGEVFVAEDTVLNHKVAVVKRSLDNPWQTTEWRAPDLGCEALQYRIEGRQPDGSFKLATEGRALTLNLGEPDPQLFDEGSNYAELKPSQVQQRFLEKMGVQENNELRKQAEFMDKAYQTIPGR